MADPEDPTSSTSSAYPQPPLSELLDSTTASAAASPSSSSISRPASSSTSSSSSTGPLSNIKSNLSEVYVNVADKARPSYEAAKLKGRQTCDRLVQILRSNEFVWQKVNYVYGMMRDSTRQRYAIVLGTLCVLFLGYLVIIRPIFTSHDDGIPYFIKPSAELQLLNNNSTAQDDPRLIRIIRNDWIAPPSNETSLNLNYPMQVDFSMGQSEVVDQILRQQRDGFYIECGALDGELRSNTLFFERQRNWKGLLIEAGPINYQQLLTKHRKAHAAPVCLSPRAYPSVMNYNRGRNLGRVLNDESADNYIKYNELDYRLVKVQCFPLYSLLLAINRTHIDYFSLDVEGVEMEILETIPFDKVDITVLTVEFKHDKQGKDYMQQFMESKGYKTAAEVKRDDGFANDFVFVKSGYGGF